MQTLRLSPSTAQPESRLKSLFWPSIRSSNDVDYLGSQGYWVCAIAGIWGCAVGTFQGHWIVGVLYLLFYYFGGVGVREHSRYAAVAVLSLFLADSLAGINSVGPGAIGIVRILITALLVSNLRAVWIASRWTPDSPEAAPLPRFGDTWGEKFADRLPPRLWPKVRLVYYTCSALFLLVVLIRIAIAVR